MYHQIIDFWFKEIEESNWFTKDETFDTQLTDRFSTLHRRAVQCELDEWRDTALGSLAEIIVLDQFSRNMFRGQPASFAYDALALALAQVAICRGFDKTLPPKQRAFMYMPFMHSESAAIHEKALELFSSPGLEHNLQFERQHKVIIDRFGRYPHRNDILGRVSTAQELEFLKGPGSSF